ncbi:MAG: ABC transporter substrate-binding protein [Clostridiales bacterium]|nr:ABC transporter substrate-binding protein [Clostridiales bacterium]
MKNILRRTIALLLALVIVLSFAACTKAPAETDEPKEATITVTDMAGNEVAIPADTKSNTVATTYGVVTPFFVTLKMSDRVLATTLKNKGFLRKVDETIINTGDVGNLSLDAEKLAGYAPSILLCRKTESEKIAIGKKLGIPTLSVYIETADQVIDAYRLLGQAFGCEERADELIGYIENELKEIDALAAGIPDDARVTAICMGSKLGQVAGDNMLQTMMIERAGGICEVTEVADDMMWVDVGVENIFSKNPDFIFASSSNPLDYKVEDLYNEAAWSGMKAVQNKQMYFIPAKMDSWDMPGPAFVLGIYYMMHCMYPDVCTSEKLQEEIDNFYDFFYGKTFAGDEIGYSVGD